MNELTHLLALLAGMMLGFERQFVKEFRVKWTAAGGDGPYIIDVSSGDEALRVKENLLQFGPNRTVVVESRPVGPWKKETK